MEAFDTNVIVRLCVRDDEEQYGRAEPVFRRAAAGAGAWLSSLVLAEVAWVLRVAYKFDRATTATTLRRLIAIDGVHVEDEATTRLALPRSKLAPRISLTTSSWNQRGAAAHCLFTRSTNVSAGPRVLDWCDRPLAVVEERMDDAYLDRAGLGDAQHPLAAKKQRSNVKPSIAGVFDRYAIWLTRWVGFDCSTGGRSRES